MLLATTVKIMHVLFKVSSSYCRFLDQIIQPHKEKAFCFLFSYAMNIINENWQPQPPKTTCSIPVQYSKSLRSHMLAFKSLTFKCTSNSCAYHKQGRFECARFESCHTASENLEYSEWIIWIFMVCFVLFGAWQPCIKILSSCILYL